MKNNISINNCERKTQRRISILLLFVCLSLAASAYADDSNAKSRHTKHAKHTSSGENNDNSPIDVKAPAEVQEIDNLSKSIRQTLDSLQKDMEKILAGIRSVAMRKSTIEAEKQTIEILPIQNDTKDQNMANLSEGIRTLAKQMADLSALYKQKDSEFKTLSAKLNELNIKKTELIELRAISGSFKNVDAGSIALNLSANNESIDSLHKQIDNVLSGAFVSRRGEERPNVPQVIPKPEPAERVDRKRTISTAKQASTVPTWIGDLISSDGRKINSDDYGPMVVAERNGLTVMTVTQAFNDKYKNTFAKFIKESYESDNLFYYVLGNTNNSR